MRVIQVYEQPERPDLLGLAQKFDRGCFSSRSVYQRIGQPYPLRVGGLLRAARNFVSGEEMVTRLPAKPINADDSAFNQPLDCAASARAGNARVVLHRIDRPRCGSIIAAGPACKDEIGNGLIKAERTYCCPGTAIHREKPSAPASSGHGACPASALAIPSAGSVRRVCSTGSGAAWASSTYIFPTHGHAKGRAGPASRRGLN